MQTYDLSTRTIAKRGRVYCNISKTFHTECCLIQIPILTANYRNGIGIALRIGIKSVSLNNPSHALSFSGMHSKMRSDEFQVRRYLRWYILPLLKPVQPGRFHDRVHHRLLWGPHSLLRGFKQNQGLRDTRRLALEKRPW